MARIRVFDGGGLLSGLKELIRANFRRVRDDPRTVRADLRFVRADSKYMRTKFRLELAFQA